MNAFETLPRPRHSITTLQRFLLTTNQVQVNITMPLTLVSSCRHSKLCVWFGIRSYWVKTRRRCKCRPRCSSSTGIIIIMSSSSSPPSAQVMGTSSLHTRNNNAFASSKKVYRLHHKHDHQPQHRVLPMVCGLWFQVYSVWFMAYGLWFMVYGLWFMVYGF